MSLLTGATDTTTTDTTTTAGDTTTDTPITPAMLGEDGSFNPEWFGHGELADYQASLSKFKDPTALAKSYANLEKMKGVPAMGEGSDENAILAFRKANGIPEESTGYDIKLPEVEGVDFPEGALEKYQGIANALNLTPSQAQLLTDNHVAMMGEESQLMEAQHAQKTEQDITDLRKEWGFKFDANIEAAKNTFQMFTSEAGISQEQAEELSANPAFARIMQAVSTKFGEANYVKGGASNPVIGNKEGGLDIINNPDNPDHAALNNPNDPRHQLVLDKVSTMLK